MQRIFFLIVLLAYLFSGCANQLENDETATPNILFICVDDLRPQLGCYGQDYMKTPHLDRMAEEGIVFNNHFVQVPTCGASRYSMLTGMRPSTRPHLSNRAIINELSGKPEGSLPETFIHHLKRNNYYTVGIGKISHQVDGLIYGYEEQPSDTLELPYSWDEMLFDSGKWGTGWNAFFGYADGSNRQGMKRQVKPYECADVENDGYPDGLTAKLAIKKLRELKMKKQPFFLGVGFFKPHLPFTAPKKYWDMYDPEKIPLSPNPQLPGNSTGIGVHKSGEFNGYQKGEEKAAKGKKLSDTYARRIRQAYFASVSYVDALIGEILLELKKLDLDKNTIVVVWGDHGWHLGDQTVWGKHTAYERALKSALIIKNPFAEIKGHRSENLVESIDLYPTLCQLSNIEPPENLDGKSFAPLFDDSTYKTKEAAYGYWHNAITMRTEKYRLTCFFKDKHRLFELYDHTNDPNETVNISQTSADNINELLPLLKRGNKGLYKDF